MKECVSHHYACDCREKKIRKAFKHILNEIPEYPEDSPVDIANEVLEDLGLRAIWADEHQDMINVEIKE